MKKIILCLLILVMLLSANTFVYAADSEDETEFTIDISDIIEMKDSGYVRIFAETPYGFSGSVMVELEDSSGKEETLEIRWNDEWKQGIWLKEGPCTVKRTYVYDTDEFLAEAEADTVNIDHDVDAEIHIRVFENPNAPELIPSWSSTAYETSEPEQNSETKPDNEPVIIPETETTPSETMSEKPSADSPKFPIKILIISILSVVVIIFCLKRSNSENKSRK